MHTVLPLVGCSGPRRSQGHWLKEAPPFLAARCLTYVRLAGAVPVHVTPRSQREGSLHGRCRQEESTYLSGRCRCPCLRSALCSACRPECCALQEARRPGHGARRGGLLRPPALALRLLAVTARGHTGRDGKAECSSEKTGEGGGRGQRPPARACPPAALQRLFRGPLASKRSRVISCEDTSYDEQTSSSRRFQPFSSLVVVK